MSSSKNVHGVLVMAKVETTYNTDSTPVAATDAMHIMKPYAPPAISHLFDGKRTVQNAGYGFIQSAAKIGRSAKGSLKFQAKGNAAAYTSSAVLVPNIHQYIKASGFDATVTTTGGSEKWTFAPTPPVTAPTSLSQYHEYQGELFKILGSYCDMTINIDGVGIPTWEFSYVGTLAGAPTTQALESGTYHTQTVIPPAAATASCLAWTPFSAAVMRSATFRMNRKIDNPRANFNGAAGHSGFTPGTHEPELEMLIEAESLASLDPYAVALAATAGQTLTLTFGATQYNRWKLQFNTGFQIMDIELVQEDPTALWRIKGSPYNSNSGAGSGVASGIAVVFD